MDLLANPYLRFEIRAACDARRAEFFELLRSDVEMHSAIGRRLVCAASMTRVATLKYLELVDVYSRVAEAEEIAWKEVSSQGASSSVDLEMPPAEIARSFVREMAEHLKAVASMRELEEANRALLRSSVNLMAASMLSFLRMSDGEQFKQVVAAVVGRATAMGVSSLLPPPYDMAIVVIELLEVLRKIARQEYISDSSAYLKKIDAYSLRGAMCALGCASMSYRLQSGLDDGIGPVPEALSVVEPAVYALIQQVVEADLASVG